MATLPPKADTATCALSACRTLKGRPIAPLEFLDLSPARISAKLAAYFWIGRIARYCHLRALAPAHTGTRPLAEHCDRGVPRNRRSQHIDVGCGAHDGAAQRHPVRTPLELEGAGRAFPLGGLGLLVMPIAAQTTTVIAIIRAIVMLSPRRWAL